jgi:hypothetical protein
MEYDIHKYYPALFLKLQEIRRKSIFDFAYKNLNKGKKEKLYRKDINTRIIARLQVFQVENLFESDLFSIQEITTIKVFREFFIYNLLGILSTEGRNFFNVHIQNLKASTG